MSEPKGLLSYDLLLTILNYLDYSSLAECSLVSWNFNHIASKLLYSRVVYSPEGGAEVLDLKNEGDLTNPSQLKSASLTKYGQYVQYLEIGGWISPRPPPRNTIAQTLLDAVRGFPNLISISLIPYTYHEDLFTEIITLLAQSELIAELCVNQSCMDAKRAPLLIQITKLRKVVLQKPSRAILELLPEWLQVLQPTLRELHFKGDCGSITPGVLRSIPPSIKSQTTAFSLGLSYSLTDQDVFSFLGELPNLSHLELQYYVQLRTPVHFPPLPSLTHLSVTTTAGTIDFSSRDGVGRLCKWIRKAIDASPLLESLELLKEEDWHPESASFDSLADHLTAKHGATLRRLILPRCFIGMKRMKALCCTCMQLEDLSIGIFNGNGFDNLLATLSTLRSLRVLSLETNRRWKYKLEPVQVFRNGPPNLWRLEIGGNRWEVQWKSDEEEVTPAAV